MIDCSHANSNKDHARQPSSAAMSPGRSPRDNRDIIGVMIESNLVAGAQKLVPGQPLVYGQSITDACIDWDETQDRPPGTGRRRPLLAPRPYLAAHT